MECETHHVHVHRTNVNYMYIHAHVHVYQIRGKYNTCVCFLPGTPQRRDSRHLNAWKLHVLGIP